jgi:hypothetical protein
MVADDPSMLEGFSREEEKEMIKDTLAKRKAKARGTRANNLSAAADAKHTMDRLMVEVCGAFTHFFCELKRRADHEPRRTRGDDRLRHVHAQPLPRQNAPRDHSVLGSTRFLSGSSEEGSGRRGAPLRVMGGEP